MQGIDVSEYQPANIGALVPYDFLIAKGTEGASYVNPYHAEQVGDALARGRQAGLYHFAHGGTVSAEADAFAAVYAPFRGRAVPILDWEAGALAAGTTWAYAMLDAMQARCGVRPLLYGSLSVIGALAGARWVAAYGSNPVTVGYQNAAQAGGGIMRQYTSRGRLPGYGGDLDLNQFYGTAADWQNMVGGTPAATPTSKGHRTVYVFTQPVDGSGTIYVSNIETGKRVAIQSIQHYTLLVRYTHAQDAATAFYQAEIDICEWYLSQIR
jgi:GH25 family lysozyme M1 (1,4-beta-N-acetylmuramidase)